MTKNTLRTMCVAAGLLVGAVSAYAFGSDATIMIDRALNSPTLTVRYKGAHAALVELRVNGESFGTRSVTSTKDNGQANFTLSTTDLRDGDNDVEIRLFDRTGKLVGSDHTNISTDQSVNAPVYLTTPKIGQTVRGLVDIKLGFGENLKNLYVTFFVDNNPKSIMNVPPYEYTWDSTKELNGWHEVEAWAVDRSASEFKTRTVRVLVDNPMGDTPRVGVTDRPAIATNPKQVGIQDTPQGMQLRPTSTHGQAAVGSGATGHAPALHGSTTSANPLHVDVVGSPVGQRAISEPAGIATGPRQLLPTGHRNAGETEYKPATAHVTVKAMTGSERIGTFLSTSATKNDPRLGTIDIHHHVNDVGEAGPVALRTPSTPPSSVIRSVSEAANLIQITHGQHIPNLGSFEVILNSKFVNFDVPTRVDDGIPMAPFRYLIEKSGGIVGWDNADKTVNAQADGHDIFLHIGDRDARINNSIISLDLAPYIDRGRTIVPVSFMRDALNVNVEYDKSTGHVLITKAK